MKKPKRIKVWVNVWHKPDNGAVRVTAHFSYPAATNEIIQEKAVCSDWKPIARFCHEVTEGEGI